MLCIHGAAAYLNSELPAAGANVDRRDIEAGGGRGQAAAGGNGEGDLLAAGFLFFPFHRGSLPWERRGVK